MAKSRANAGFGIKFQLSDGGTLAGAKSSKAIGTTNQQTLVTAILAGTAGNSIQYGHVNGGASQSLSVGVVGTVITVNLATDGASAVTSTVSDVVDAVNGNAAAAALVLATNGVGNGSGLAIAGAVAALTGGTNGTAVFTDLGEITDVPGVGTTHRTDEVTHMASPGGWAEFLGLGVKEGKAFTLALNFVADDAAQKSLFKTRVEDGSENTYRIVFTDDVATTLTFAALITDTDIGHSRDSKADISIQVQPTGAYSWNP